MSGWIKLHRTVTKKGWYKKPDYLSLWVHLLLKANHAPAEFLSKGKIIKVNPGQFITGRDAISAEIGVHSSKVERILKCFESEQQIEQRKTNIGRWITIINWNQYQISEQRIEQQMNNGRTTDEQPVNTNKNDKKVNNEKESTGPPSEILNSNLYRQPNIPTKQQVLEAIVNAGGTKEMAKSFYEKHEGTGWFLNGSPIVNYTALAQRFVSNWKTNDDKKKGDEPPTVKLQTL